MEFEFTVNMTCGHCVNAVNEALEGNGKISNIDINLDEKTVKGFIANNDISTDEIKKIIEDIGFDVT